MFLSFALIIWFSHAVKGFVIQSKTIANTVNDKTVSKFKDYCVRSTGTDISEVKLNLLNICHGHQRHEWSDVFPQAVVTIAPEHMSEWILEDGTYDIVTITSTWASLNESAQVAMVYEAARILRFGGCLLLSDVKCDFNKWTDLANRRMSHAGFVYVHVQHTPTTSFLMASRSRFPSINMDTQPLIRPQCSELQPKKESILLQLADVPLLLIKLLLAYSIVKIIADLYH